MTTQLIPATSPRTALERKYVQRILTADPGIGEKSLAIANSLADSGLSAGAAAMLLQAVYAPTDPEGRGQGTRLKWFVEAVQNRYSNRLDKIRSDYKAFRSFISDMEEVSEMRDELIGNGFSISFQGAFILWELGEDADSVQLMVYEHLQHLLQYKGSAIKRVVQAAMDVQAGKFGELSTALAFLNPMGSSYGDSND